MHVMRKAIFFMCDQYADWEGAYLSSQLNQKDDWQVITASVTPIVTSIGGFKTQVDETLNELSQNADLLILIGGDSWKQDYPKLTATIRAYLKQGKAVGAICGAVDYLARNGLLTGYQHTGNAQFLWNGDRQYTNPQDFQEKQVVRDRNLITANGTATLDFTDSILSSLFTKQSSTHREMELQRLGFYRYVELYGNPYQ
ncbi:glutamine amidotransferase [Companilactobacillus nantensis]|nr:glutamine amidotransferase [Companilactobacillus nantensis]